MASINPAILLLVAAFAAPAVVAIVGAIRYQWVPRVAVIMTGLAFATSIWTCFQDDSIIFEPWASTWNLNISFALDGLSRMYALLATGVGFFVVVYAYRYIRIHLHHDHRPLDEQVRFYGFLLLFMAAMVGLVMAQDLILIFLFWDLTAISSYFLIGYDRNEEESRSSAQMAFLVTGISAVLVLIGSLWLGYVFGTYELPEIFQLVHDDTSLVTSGVGLATAFITVGALAKSAQVPLHFWLPRAMAAPTPVSAYLHSAAMVAAGVFLIGRMYPLVSQIGWLLDGLLIIGLLSMAVGGVLALTRNGLKQVLAYSTISQYGYVVVMFGLGGHYGVAGATFYVFAHALVKSALFMTAGAVIEATSKKGLEDVGGLARRMPLLAAGSACAASGLVALPLTIGFFKDELFFAAALAHGTGFAVIAVVGAALTFAYILRFWWHIFMGDVKTEPKPIPQILVWPVVILGALTVLFGIWTYVPVWIAERAASVSAGVPIEIHIAYHLDTRPENIMALSTWALGVLVYLTRRAWWPVALAAAHFGDRFGPAHWYFGGLRALNEFSDRAHRQEVRDLRSRVASILLPAGILVGVDLVLTANVSSFEIGSFTRDDIALITMITASVVSAIVVIILRDHFQIAISLSSVGFSLAGVYAFMGAPNVAIVALVVETALTLFILGMLVLMPRAILRLESEARPGRRLLQRDAFLASVAGAMAFFVAWGTLSRPSPTTEVIDSFEVLTPAAHGYNVVTVILADFRAFDTMGEVTVVALTLLGIIGLLRRGRMR